MNNKSKISEYSFPCACFKRVVNTILNVSITRYKHACHITYKGQ